MKFYVDYIEILYKYYLMSIHIHIYNILQIRSKVLNKLINILTLCSMKLNHFIKKLVLYINIYIINTKEGKKW